MRILNYLLILLLFMFTTTIVYSASFVDITGIYQSTDGSSNYLTVNRNGDTYVIINITKEIDLLSQLLLINEDEINLLPSIEEFTFISFITLSDDKFTFSSLDDELRFPLDLIIPFPDRTTQKTVNNNSIHINVIKRMDEPISLLFYTDGLFLMPTSKRYEKIF